MFDWMNERNKTKLNKNESFEKIKCYLINDKKPKKKQNILYVGNHGFNEGVYDGFADGIGWVALSDGSIDCFDEWLPNN